MVGLRTVKKTIFLYAGMVATAAIIEICFDSYLKNLSPPVHHPGLLLKLNIDLFSQHASQRLQKNIESSRYALGVTYI
jgi:hypothetical protein